MEVCSGDYCRIACCVNERFASAIVPTLQVALLQSILTSRHSFLAVVRQRPELLSPSNQPAISSSANCLYALGFSQSQVRRLCLQAPALMTLNPLQIAERMRLYQQLKVPSDTITSAVAEHPLLLLENPRVLLTSTLRLFRRYRVKGSHGHKIVTADPSILAVPSGTINEVLAVLDKYGIVGEDLATVIEQCPGVVWMTQEALDIKLRFLTDILGKSPLEVVAFPRYFVISVANYIGPRSAFIMSRWPELAQTFAIATLFTRSDEDFSEHLLDTLVEEYIVFKLQWQSMYGSKFGLKPKFAAVLAKSRLPLQAGSPAVEGPQQRSTAVPASVGKGNQQKGGNQVCWVAPDRGAGIVCDVNDDWLKEMDNRNMQGLMNVRSCPCRMETHLGY